MSTTSHGRTWVKAFGALVACMIAFIAWRILLSDVHGAAIYQAVFVERWPWWAGGAAIATVVVSLVLVDNELLGVSGGCGELCVFYRDPTVRRSWRPRFLFGIVAGGAASALLGGRTPTWAMGSFDALFGRYLPVKLGVLFGAGMLIGAGARLAGGCTSGHGIVGTALGARPSFIATALFLLAGFATTQLLHFMSG